MAGWCFISHWVSIDWLATNSHPFEVDISVDQVGACSGVGIDSTDAEVIKASLIVSCRRIVRHGKAEAALSTALTHPFVVNRANDCMGSRSR